MDFTHLVHQTRSYRRFVADEHVPMALLESAIDIARCTPSPRNLQPLRYVLVNDTQTKDALFAPLKWAGALGGWSPAPHERPSAYIVILRDMRDGEYYLLDAGIALATIMLFLSEQGYASCALASIDKEVYAQVLDVGAPYEPLLVIAIGKPNETVHIAPWEGKVAYYRDTYDTHCVPKRHLDALILKKFTEK